MNFAKQKKYLFGNSVTISANASLACDPDLWIMKGLTD